MCLAIGKIQTDIEILHIGDVVNILLGWNDWKVEKDTYLETLKTILYSLKLINMSFAISVPNTQVNLYDELNSIPGAIETIKRRSDSKNIAFTLRNWTTWTVLYVWTVWEDATIATGLPLKFEESMSADENSLRDINLISDTTTEIRIAFAESEQR